MIKATELEQEIWRPFFDSISKSLRGKAADITIADSSETVHQSRCWQLNGVTYDPHDRALIISCRDQEHVIASPSLIRVERNGPIVSSIEITKARGEREIVRFVEPLCIAER